MRIDDYEELIEIESDELAETLLGMSYYSLSPEMRAWIRSRAIESLFAETNETSIAA
jgi:hypothetical protein